MLQGPFRLRRRRIVIQTIYYYVIATENVFSPRLLKYKYQFVTVKFTLYEP